MCSLFLGRHLSQPLLLPICIGMRAVSVVSVATMESMLASCKASFHPYQVRALVWPHHDASVTAHMQGGSCPKPDQVGRVLRR